MANKVNIPVDAETLDNIVIGQLLEIRDSLKKELGAGGNIFVYGDQEEDDAQIQKYVDAFTLVLDYMMPYEDFVELVGEYPQS